MEYLPTILAVVQVLFLLLGVYVVYKVKKGEKVNAIVMAAYEAYQKVRKMDLLGEIEKDNRLNQGLKLAEDILYSEKKIDMTTEVKKIIAKQFETLHTKDKNDALLMNAVAVDPEKKSKD